MYRQMGTMSYLYLRNKTWWVNYDLMWLKYSPSGTMALKASDFQVAKSSRKYMDFEQNAGRRLKTL